MNIFDDREKNTQKQAGVQRASLPSAQKNALPAPLLLTKEGVAMADGKGGMKLITPPTTRQTTPIVKPKAAQSAGKQLVNTGTMVSDTGSNKRQAPLTLTREGVAMADGKGGMKLITPSTTQTTPLVKPKAVQSAGKQLVNTGTMVSDTGSNKKDQRQGFFARAGKTVSGGAKSSLASNMDAMGAMYQAGQGQRTLQNTEELRDAQWAVARAKYAYDGGRSPAAKAELDSALTKMRALATVLGDGAYEQALEAAYDAAAKFGTEDLNELYRSLGNVQPAQGTGVQQQAGEAARDLAAQVQRSGGRDIEKAKEGLGVFGQQVVDAGASMTQVAGDMLLNAAMGVQGSKLPLAFRAFGGGTQAAREDGADLQGQLLYGGAVAAKEVVTEMFSNIAAPFAKAYGGGTIDDAVQRGISKAVDKLGKSETGKRALNALLQVAASGTGEGLEELIGDWMEWQMPRIYGGEVDSASEVLANSLYDFAVGGMTGAAGSLISPGTYRYDGNEGSADTDPQSQNAAPQYSIKKTRTMPWRSQIASYYNGNLKSSDSLYLGTTGAEIGTRLGVADAPLYLPTSVITKAERDGSGSRSAHSMNRGDILALEDELRGSAAVVYNPARRALVYLTKGKASGKPLAVAVQVDTDLFGERAHKITSIHNRGSMEGLLQNLGSDATVLVKNSSELNRLLPGTEIQSLQLLANVEFAGDNIPQEATGVKYAQLPRLVDANGMDAQQRTAWLGALAQMPQEKQMQFETAADIAQRFGAVVQARAMQEGVQGSYQDGVISIDPSAADPVRQVLIHELTHHMERSGLYGRFSDAALRFVAENMGADVDTLRRAVIADYARAGVTLDEDGATREIVAKFAEEKLFTDEATVRRLLVQDRSLFQRIYDWLRDTVAKLQGTQEQRRLIDAQNLYEKALRQAETGTQGKGVQYDIKYPQYSEADIKNNSERLRSMEAVERLSGNEIGDRNIPLKDRVQAFFDSLGNNIRTDRFGDVALGNSSVRSEIRHGHTPQKVMTYAAIPSVLQNGVVVYQNVKNAHELERILVAAPVEVGAEHERMYVGVMLQRDPQNQRLYLHDVVTEKEFTTGGNGHLNTTGPNAANGELFTTDILRNALNVNTEKLSTGRSIDEMAGRHLSDEDIAWQENQERAQAARRKAAIDRMAGWTPPPPRRGEGVAIAAEVERRNAQGMPRTVNVPPVDTWGATFDSRAEAQRRSYAEAISDLTTQQVSRDAEDMRNGTGSYAYRYYESPENIGVDEGVEAADRIYAEMVRKSGHNPYTGTDIAEELAEASRETMRKKSVGERLAGAVDTLDGLEDAVRADSELRQMRREAREAEGLKMPETLRKIGVEPFGSEADYLGAEDLAQQASENERARRRTKKEAAKIPASEKEKLFARQLAEGAISWDDVPQTVNRSTVDVLADYYRVMDTEMESRLLRDRRDLIFQREEAKMPALLGMDVRYDEGGLRENGKSSGKVAQQVSTLRRNLQTPARVCTTEWGREHGKRVYETLFQPVTENNGRQIDWVNSMLDRVRTFKGKDGKARELNRAERDLVQRLVESRAAGDRVQQQGKQYAEAKQNMDAAKGVAVEQYLRDKGVLQEEKEQAIRSAAAEYSGKKKRGELKNTTYAAYMAEAVPGYAEYQKAKNEARKELYEKVIVGEITSRSAEARLQEAINGGERAIRYFERLGVDWHKYEEANYSQEAIFRRGTRADSKTQEYRGAVKAWSAAKKNGPFLRAAENVRNGWSAADAAKEFGIDKSQQEYRDLENYAAYLEAKKRAESDTGVDPTVVDEAVKAYSGLYKELYDGINTFLAAHGYKPIGFIEGYAPHMQPEETKTAFSKALKMLGLDDTAMMLPTSISGITADLKPYKQYDPFFQTRHGDKTEYDIAKGFENYVYYLGNIFYHTDDIMRIRTAARYIRKTYTSEEASEQISWAENARNFDDANVEEFLRFNGIIKKGTKLEPGDARNILNEYIDGLYEQIGDVSRYSEMVKYLDNYANRLAGKQNMLDRGAEAAAGRRSLNWVNTLSGRYGGAKLAFNVGSALNQTSQLPMVMAENGEMTTARAIRDFFTEGRGDFVKNSSFLKGKKGVDWLLGPETGWEKFKEKGFAMTEAVDSFTSYVAVRSKYLKEKRLGASDAEAMKAADEYGRNVMGSRARGEKPMLFDTKNPFWQIATRFQLEAMNSWEHITRDLPAEYRQMAAEKGKAAATARIGGQAARYVLYAFLINCGIGALSGGSPVPYDVLGVTAEAVGAAMGMTGGEAIKTLLDDVLQAVFDQRLFGTDEPEDDEDKDWWAALESFFSNAANDVPILGRAAALAGIGDQTLPTADFSKLGDLVDSARNNGVFSADTLDKAMTAAGEFLYGGNQLRKTAQGTMAAAQGGVYSKGKLRYQVDRSPWNVGRAVLFGRGALDETEEYYARQAKQFSEKQTTAWEKLQETGEPDKTAQEQRQLAKKGYDLIQELRSIEKEDDDNRAAMQRQALREADVSDESKAVVWYEMMASEKDRETLDMLKDADRSKAALALMDMKDVEKEDDEDNCAAMKRQILRKADISDDAKAVVWYEALASEKDQKAMDALKDADRGEVAGVMMDMKDSKKAGEKLRIIMSSRLTDEQKGIFYLNTLAGDEDKDKIKVLQDAYMDAYQYLAYKTAISGLSGRFEKLNAINTLELTNYQKDALYYMNDWSEKTHDKAPWVQGVSAEASANRLAAAVAHRESQPEQTPQWQQSLEDYLGIYEQRRQAAVAYIRGKQALESEDDDIYARRRKAAVAYIRGRKATSEEGDIYEQRRQAAVAYIREKKG